MRLLLVEDERQLRESLADRLRSEGFAVDVASLEKSGFRATHTNLNDDTNEGIAISSATSARGSGRCISG